MYPRHNITEEIAKRAQQLFITEPFKKANLIRDDMAKNKEIGSMGEALFEYVMIKSGNEIRHVGDWDYDFIVNGYRVEVKTRLSGVDPFAEMWCNVQLQSRTKMQRCDFYVFMAISKRHPWGWCLGGISKKKLTRVALYKPKGSEEDNGFVLRSNSYSVPASYLTEVRHYGAKVG